MASFEMAAVAIARGSPPPSSGRIELRPIEMGTEAERLRLAIGVFYDADRLIRALNEIFGIGLTSDDVWIAGQKPLLDGGSSLHRRFAEAGGELVKVANAIDCIGELHDELPLWGTCGPMQQLLAKARSARDTTGSGRFPINGRFGRVLQDHAMKGAIIATTRALGPTEQDQCVRILLRHSLHTVHSKECGPARNS